MAAATVLISGLGIAGPALAYWLARTGHRPILVERNESLRTGGHAVDIRGTALEVVARMGLEAAVREARTQIMTLSAVRPDGRTHDVSLRPLHEMRGDREVEIMRDDLVRILYGAVADDVEVRFGDSMRTLHPDGGRVGVEFEHGSPQEADLVIGADGHHSAIRELSFGPDDRFLHHLGAYLSIFTVDNILGLADRAMLYNEPGGKGIGVFTARGNQRAKVVLMFRSAPLEIDFRDRYAQQATLRDTYAGMGWQTARLIEAMPAAYDFYFDEMSQVRMPTWSSGPVALLGDAAYGPSPMSGQGTSLALTGAYLLAHHLSSSVDTTTALRNWENHFRSNVEINQRLATHGMATLLPASRRAIFLRNQTMRMMPALARVGRGFGGRIERASRSVTLPPMP
jgi:2-polyprenyl-6-methoxyphenol hydroxylase-like FAD-dependent oxidoreductase